jgi:hypothetical protein
VKDLRHRPYKKNKCHLPSTSQKEEGVKRAKLHFSRHGKSEIINILSPDEKNLTKEQAHNHQNDSIYAKNCQPIDSSLRRVVRGRRTTFVRVFVKVTENGVPDQVFLSQGVKVKAKNNISDILVLHIKSLNESMFNGDLWPFERDSAIVHMNKNNKMLLKNHFPEFITKEECPRHYQISTPRITFYGQSWRP